MACRLPGYLCYLVGGGPERVVGEMGVAGGHVHIGVVADHRQFFADQQVAPGVGVP